MQIICKILQNGKVEFQQYVCFFFCEAVSKHFFLEIHLTLDVPRPMFFVFLVLVNGDVGDFHDDGSFTHGEPGARIFGGLRPSKLQRTGKTMKMCSYSTGSKINLTPFVALLLPGTFDVETDNLSLVLENDFYSKPFACVGMHLIIYIPRISNIFIEFPIISMISSFLYPFESFENPGSRLLPHGVAISHGGLWQGL